MTCIIGAVYRGCVYMGGDSCISIGDRRETVSTRKIDRIHIGASSMLIGHAGNVRDVNILSRLLKQIRLDELMNAYDATSQVAEQLRVALNDVSALNVYDGLQHSNSSFLVGYKGQLFVIHSDFSVVSPSRSFYAIGSGTTAGMAAMIATATYDLDISVRIMNALHIASELDVSVGPPFYIEVAYVRDNQVQSSGVR